MLDAVFASEIHSLRPLELQVLRLETEARHIELSAQRDQVAHRDLVMARIGDLLEALEATQAGLADALRDAELGATARRQAEDGQSQLIAVRTSLLLSLAVLAGRQPLH